MSEALRERIIEAVLTPEQAVEVLHGLNRAIGNSDGYYLDCDTFGQMLIDYSKGEKR